MRILHVCQPSDGGSAVVVRQLVQAGVDAGDEVAVACPAGGLLAGWVTAAGASWVELGMTRSPQPADLAHLVRLRRLQRDVDVVHAHSSKAGAITRLAAALSPRSRPRLVFTPHGWSWYVGGRAAPVYRWFERLAARVTDAITVVSRAELDDGRTVLGPAAALELVENGVDTTVFSPDGPVAERGPAPLLVQVGRLSVQKGQDRSIRALAQLEDRTTRLRLVGDGPLAPELRELAGTLGVLDRVELTGTADPRPHLRAADVVLLPSRWEGMSLALLEAMAVGTTIISGDCGGSDALGEAGLVVPAEDDDRAVARLVEHLEPLLADPLRRAELGRAARRRAEDHFGLARVLASYRRVWGAPGAPTPTAAAGLIAP